LAVIQGRGKFPKVLSPCVQELAKERGKKEGKRPPVKLEKERSQPVRMSWAAWQQGT